MDEVRLENFRCFREQQKARLAPLTLLVGENSTGKTSFLAMVRALNAISNGRLGHDFKEPPYDLGSFDEIAHHRGGRGGRATEFTAGFSASTPIRRLGKASLRGFEFDMDVGFVRRGAVPAPHFCRTQDSKAWIEERLNPPELTFGVASSAWKWQSGMVDRVHDDDGWGFLSWRRLWLPTKTPEGFSPLPGTQTQPTRQNLASLDLLSRISRRDILGIRNRLFAAAPVRSKPQRTYDPSPYGRDAEGNYVPMYLADTFFRNPKQWTQLKSGLEAFGRESGLFDEIAIRPLGKRQSEPFQVQVRKVSRRAKGPRRNVIDVGYGVSQVLPILAELFREDAARTFLLQQPEVHLHPSAQAALGTLFCRLAGEGRQFLVETHSDHLIDRIRMDIRDGTTKLKPEEVSILYFERGNLDVRIHSLGIDAAGNILHAPSSYRRFFMDETRRSLQL